jgi:hypothetical protein
MAEAGSAGLRTGRLTSARMIGSEAVWNGAGPEPLLMTRSNHRDPC